MVSQKQGTHSPRAVNFSSNINILNQSRGIDKSIIKIQSLLFSIPVLISVFFLILSTSLPTQAAVSTGSAFAVKSAASGFCIDTLGSRGFSILAQEPCNNGANQSFTLVSSPQSGAYYIKSTASGMCWDIVGGSTSPGAKIQQYTCVTATPEYYSLTAAGTNTYVIHTPRGCVDLAARTAGGAIDQNTCNGAATQVFQIAAPGGVAVSVSPTSTTISSGNTQQFAATVTGSSNTAVTWSTSAGSISSSGTLTAPTCTSNTSVTVQATSQADTTKSASAAVTVTPGGTATVAIAVSPTAATISSGGTKQFTATVTGSSNTGVTWSASGGSISSSGLLTAPTVSSSTAITVQGTSQADTTKSASATVTVNPTSSAQLILLRETVASWTYRDYGKGTNVGSNSSGAGYLYDNQNVGGSIAMGMTATPTAQASPAAGSDSVYLWEPSQAWNYSGQEWWLRTSFYFPSSASSVVFNPGEAPYQPTTGQLNWFLELHNDSNPNAGGELANISFGVFTDYPVGNTPGKNPRMVVRLMGGPDSNIQTTYVYENGVGSATAAGVPLQYDHWYPLLIHVKLDPSAGIFEWFENSTTTPIYSNTSIPTLYTRPAGYVSPSYTSLTADNYRYHVTGWNSTVYMGPLAVGPTQESVMSAF